MIVERTDCIRDVGIALLTSRRGDWVVVRADDEAVGVYGAPRGLAALDALDGIEAYVRAVVADYDGVEIAEMSRRRRIAGYELVLIGRAAE